MAIPGIVQRLPLTGVEMLIKKHTGISIEDIRSESRARTITDARHLFCALAVDRTDKDLRLIGAYINRDRNTVRYGMRQAHTVPELIAKYETIKNN